MFGEREKLTVRHEFRDKTQQMVADSVVQIDAVRSSLERLRNRRDAFVTFAFVGDGRLLLLCAVGHRFVVNLLSRGVHAVW